LIDVAEFCHKKINPRPDSLLPLISGAARVDCLIENLAQARKALTSHE
jgi:hypothetical protein